MKGTVLLFLLFTLFVSSNTLADEFPTFKLLHNQWTMISLPATPPESSNTLEAILGDDFLEVGGEYGTDWSVSSYVAESKAYETLSLTDTLGKGRGYWIIQIIEDEKPVTLDMPIDSTVTSVTESIPLTASSDGADLWNLVGNPFATSLNLAELRLVTDAPSCSDGSCDLNKAKENSLVGNKVWVYDGESNIEKGTDDQLAPWGGFWVSALAGSNGYSLALSTSGGDEVGVYMGTYDTPGTASSVALSNDGSKVYLDGGEAGSLLIIDISNPVTPTLLGSYTSPVDRPGAVTSITLSSDGSKAYITRVGVYAGLEIVDISSPASPTLLGSYFNQTLWTYGVDISSDGSKAYVVDGKGFYILDVSNPAAPALLGGYESNNFWPKSITLSSDGSKAYPVGTNGLHVMDISNPAAPRLIGKYNTPGAASSAVLSSDGSKAYVMDNNSYTSHGQLLSEGIGLVVIDISNPAAPALQGSYDTGDGKVVALSSDGSKAYVAAGRSLKVVDITNPASPIRYRSFDVSPDSLASVALSSDDSKAYVAAGSAGLGIIDLTATGQ
jgi:hypothetical protein